VQALSKSRIIDAHLCPKRLWLKLYRQDLEQTSEDAQERFAVGTQVGKLAVQIYDPTGKGVAYVPREEGYDEVVAMTVEQLKLGKPIFEAGFKAAGGLAYADVMMPVRRRGQAGWRMVEVKSSASVKDEQKDDLAIQAYVARSAGVQLHAVAIAHLDSTWVYPGGGDYDGLLVEVDQTEEAFEREEEVAGWIDNAHAIAAKHREPTVAMGLQCNKPYECAFMAYCQSQSATKAPKYSVACLKGNLKTELKKLIKVQGVSDLRKVPNDLLNARHLRVKTHTLANTTYFDADAAANALAAHKLPALFLDFETINLAVPIWSGTRPFQANPFQFSLHRLNRSGKLGHKSYLDLSGKDPARQLALALIDYCGERSPIYIYSKFESTIVKQLAERFPKLARPLLAIDARLIDLQAIAKKHYYHPQQKGSWSLKAVLPTIAPELRYDNLDEVQEGGMAMAAFREAIHTETPTERKAELERQLLAYCQRDTEALVRLWRHFTGRATMAC